MAKRTYDNIGCSTIIAGIIVAFTVGLATENTPVGIVIFIISCFVGWPFLKKQEKISKAEIKAHEEEAKNTYEKLKVEANIPVTALTVTLIRKSPGSTDMHESHEHEIWLENNQLCFFPKETVINSKLRMDQIKTKRIPLSKIEYFATQGEVYRENKISGGGGGGSSINRAIVGGAIAGGVSAVIASRRKTDPIKSELIVHDSRESYLNYFDNANAKLSIFFRFEDFARLNQLLPEKNSTIVIAIKANTITNSMVSRGKSDSIADQLRQLAELRNDGILSEEEFVQKKKILLDKIQ